MVAQTRLTIVWSFDTLLAAYLLSAGERTRLGGLAVKYRLPTSQRLLNRAPNDSGGLYEAQKRQLDEQNCYNPREI